MNLRKNYRYLFIPLLVFFIGCGEGSDKSIIPSKNNSEVKNSEKLYLYKKTEYYPNGTTKIRTYNYDNNHHLIYDGCSNSYDKFNRIKEINCKTENSVYHYEGKKLSSYELYKNGHIHGKWSVLEWNNEKPKVIQWKIKVANKWTTNILTLGYTGGNTTSIKIKAIYPNGRTLSAEIEQTFDNKKIPNEGSKNMFGGYATFEKQAFIGEISTNNKLKQKKTTFNGKTIILNHEITYNDEGYPIRIDRYMDGEYYYSTVYEYIELD